MRITNFAAFTVYNSMFIRQLEVGRAEDKCREEEKDLIGLGL